MAVSFQRPSRDPADRPEITVYTPTTAPAVFRLLGEPVEVSLHHTTGDRGRGRTVACEGNDCPYCAIPGARAPRPHFYCAAELRGANPKGNAVVWSRKVLGLSAQAYWDLVGTIPADRTFRGAVISIARDKRTGPDANRAPVRARVLEHLASEAIPPEFDVVPILLIMWGMPLPSALAEPLPDGAVIPMPAEEPQPTKKQPRSKRG